MQQAPRLNINLASAPFRKDRALLTGAAVLAGVLTLLLVFLSVLVVKERDAARTSRAGMEALQQQLRKLSAEEASLQAELRKPANASVLDKSAFVNTLLARKGISWTRLFADLQEVFPYNVRLVSVRPFITQDNRIQLEMVVASQQPEPVIQLFRRLESASIFNNTQVQAEQPPNQNEPFYRYRVSVSYAQKL
jgi:hypothetical protein